MPKPQLSFASGDLDLSSLRGAKATKQSIPPVIPGWCVGTRPGISRFRVRFFASPRNDSLALLRSHLRLAVADAIDGAVPVVGDQKRAVLHLHHIDRPANVFVVFEEARDQRLDRLHRAVLVQLDDDDITAGLPGSVP